MYKKLESRITRLENLLNESKQVGTLYHVCTLDSYLKHILPNDTLQSSGSFNNKVYGGNNWVSFTRDPYFVISLPSLVLIQLVIDGDKLSENYKVRPYNFYSKPIERKYYDDTSTSNDTDDNFIYDKPEIRQFEEVVSGPIKNISKYIKEVRFDLAHEPRKDELDKLTKNKNLLAGCVYYPFIPAKSYAGKHRLNTELFSKLRKCKGASILKVLQVINGENDVRSQIKKLNDYINIKERYCDPDGISEVLSNDSCRDYFQKYGEYYMRDLIKLYTYSFNNRNGRCENSKVIPAIKAVLDSGIDITKFTYVDDHGYPDDLFNILPKYGSLFDKKESELSKLIKTYM